MHFGKDSTPPTVRFGNRFDARLPELDQPELSCNEKTVEKNK